MMLPRPSAAQADRDAARPFGAAELLHLVLEAARPTLGFDVAVAVLIEDGAHVVPVFTSGRLAPGALEGVHVQALAAFVELAGPDHATWPSSPPDLTAFRDATDAAVNEPETYEDAPLVVEGAVTGMLRISTPRPLTREQRAHYFALAADVSGAIERLGHQRDETRLVQERLLQSEKMSSVGQPFGRAASRISRPVIGGLSPWRCPPVATAAAVSDTCRRAAPDSRRAFRSRTRPTGRLREASEDPTATATP